jgi:hypothetical protein
MDEEWKMQRSGLRYNGHAGVSCSGRGDHAPVYVHTVVGGHKQSHSTTSQHESYKKALVARKMNVKVLELDISSVFLQQAQGRNAVHGAVVASICG